MKSTCSPSVSSSVGDCAADGHQTSIGWDKVRLEVEKWHRGVALATPQHRLPGPPFIRWAWPSCAGVADTAIWST